MMVEVLKQTLNPSRLPEVLPEFHTVIGYLPWSFCHLKAKGEKPGNVWGGVFCLNASRFAGEFADQYRRFGLFECSFLAADARLDIRQIGGVWRAYLRQAGPGSGYRARTGYAVFAELGTRFGFFRANQERDGRNHLDDLEKSYDFVQYHHRDKPEFWTFKPR